MVYFKDMVGIQLVVPQVKFESVAIRNPTLLSPNVFATRNGLLLESIAASSSLSLATPLLSKYLNGLAKGICQSLIQLHGSFAQN